MSETEGSKGSAKSHLRRGWRGVVVGTMLLAGVLMLSSVPVKAWSVDGALNYPTTIYPGATYTFSLDLTNTGSKPMRIDEIWLGFDWQPEGVMYTNDDTPKVIDSGDSYTFSWSVAIPDGILTNTHHVATVLIEAADPGWLTEWGSPYRDT
ncbi:MAG: hypothetical protein AB1665_01780, partial [Candidatus Thermoplasmatota archaeon]